MTAGMSAIHNSGPKLLSDELVEAQTDERSYDRARGIGRAVEPERTPAIFARGVVGDDRVTRWAAQPLAHPIGCPSHEHHRPCTGNREEELAER